MTSRRIELLAVVAFLAAAPLVGCGGSSTGTGKDAGATGGSSGGHGGSGGGAGSGGRGGAGGAGGAGGVHGTGGTTSSTATTAKGGATSAGGTTTSTSSGGVGGTRDAGTSDLAVAGDASAGKDATADRRLDDGATTTPDTASPGDRPDAAASDTGRDAAADSPAIVQPDAPAASPDLAADTAPACGTCSAGLTCGGGGDPLRCGITVVPKPGKVCSTDGWCWENPRPQGNDLRAVYAISPSDIWAAGAHGTVLHFDGADWTGTAGLLRNYVTPTGESYNENWASFNSVWASGPGDVWLATTVEDRDNHILRPNLLHGDGTHWNEVQLPATKVWITGIWGSAADDVWLLDALGHTIYRGNPSQWNTITVPASVSTLDNTATPLWGISATEVYVATSSGIYRYDGASFTQESTKSLAAVWGSAAAGHWGAGSSTVYHRIGSTWVALNPPSGCGSGLWGTSETSLWFGGCYFDGSQWTGPFNKDVVALAGPKNGNPGGGPVGVGNWGVIVDLTATAATPYPSPLGDVAPTMHLSALLALPPNDVWMAGQYYATTVYDGLFLHWDGNAYTSLATSATTSFADLLAASTGGAPWASDGSGKIWQSSNGTFSAVTTAPAVLDSTWAAANDAIWGVRGAAIYAYDGSTWQTATHPLATSTIQLRKVWGLGKSDVWVIGSSGMTEHWDGTKWTAYSTPSTSTLNAIWNSDSTHV